MIFCITRSIWGKIDCNKIVPIVFTISSFSSYSISVELSFGSNTETETGGDGVTGHSSVEKESVWTFGFGWPKAIHNANSILIKRPEIAPWKSKLFIDLNIIPKTFDIDIPFDFPAKWTFQVWTFQEAVHQPHRILKEILAVYCRDIVLEISSKFKIWSCIWKKNRYFYLGKRYRHKSIRTEKQWSSMATLIYSP